MVATIELLKRAKAVSYLAPLSTEEKNNALFAMAKALVNNADSILEANALDLENAKGNISEVMLDRLRLDISRIKGMAKGIEEVAKLPDNVGKVISKTIHQNGLEIMKTAVPFGVV